MRENRLAHIDTIRAVAALFVCLMHFVDVKNVSEFTKTHGNWLYDFANTIDIGRIGVLMFFGVSGYLIPSSLSKGQSLKNFLIKRLFRLYPAYWASIPLAVFVEYWLYNRDIQPSTVFANVTMFTKAIGAPYIQGLYWTLSAELIFYVISAALFAMRLLNRPAVIAGISLCLTILYWADVNYYLGPVWAVRDELFVPEDGEVVLYVAALSIMFFGAALRHLDDGCSTTTAKYIAIAVGLIYIIGFPLCGLITYPSTPAKVETVRTYVSSSVGVLSFVILAKWVRVSWWPAVMMGQVSYSLYLFHPIVLWGVVWWLVYHWPTAHIPTTTLCVSMLILSLALAWVMFKLVEKPSINLGNKVVARLSRTGRAKALELSPSAAPESAN